MMTVGLMLVSLLCWEVCSGLHKLLSEVLLSSHVTEEVAALRWHSEASPYLWDTKPHTQTLHYQAFPEHLARLGKDSYSHFTG